MSEFISIEHHSQAPIRHKNIRLVPFARSVRLRLPGGIGGFVWSRPTSLLVVYPDGREEVLPIQDRTLRFFLFTLLAGISGWLVFKWLERRIMASRSMAK